jgi:hypothetical protein
MAHGKSLELQEIEGSKKHFIVEHRSLLVENAQGRKEERVQVSTYNMGINKVKTRVRKPYGVSKKQWRRAVR